MKRKTFSKEVRETFSKESGMIYPWMLKGRTPKVMHYDCLIEDVFTYWDQDAQYREGFSYTGDSVVIPAFFIKISGVYKKSKQQKLLEKLLTQTGHSLIFESVRDFEKEINVQRQGSWGIQNDEKKFSSFYEGYNRDNENAYSFDNLDSDWKKTCENVRKKICKTFDKFEPYAFAVSDNIVRMLSTFDFAREVPKIVIFEQKNETLSDLHMAWLSFFHELGLDICVYSSSGNIDLEKTKSCNVFILDEMRDPKPKKEKKEKKKWTKMDKSSLVSCIALSIVGLLVTGYGVGFVLFSLLNLSINGWLLLVQIVWIILSTVVCCNYDNIYDFYTGSKFERGIERILNVNVVVFVCSIILFLFIGVIWLCSTGSSGADVQDGFKTCDVTEKIDNYTLTYDESFVYSKSEESFTGYIGNDASNKEMCNIRILYKDAELFDLSSDLDPFQYFEYAECEMPLEEGTVKATLSYEFYDGDKYSGLSGGDEDDLEHLTIIEKPIEIVVKE